MLKLLVCKLVLLGKTEQMIYALKFIIIIPLLLCTHTGTFI